MQLGALIKTRKGKWAVMVLAVVVCAGAVWMWLDVGHKPTDEEKFQRMLSNEERGRRLNLFRARHRFPAPLANALARLERTSYDRSFRQNEELLASGYVVSFPFTNWNNNYPSLKPVFDIVKGQVGTNCYLRFYVKSNVVVVTCRSNDAARVRALIEK